MFFGTTGTGKTKFFILQIMQAILRNEVVIVIDPKADRELKEQMIECSKLCLKEKQFYCLDLNEPDCSKQSFNLPFGMWNHPRGHVWNVVVRPASS